MSKIFVLNYQEGHSKYRWRLLLWVYLVCWTVSKLYESVMICRYLKIKPPNFEKKKPLRSCNIHTSKGCFISLCYFLERCTQIGYIFPIILCLLLLFFSQLFVRTPQTTILLFCIFSLGDSFDHHLLFNIWTSVHSSSGTLNIRVNYLNLFGTSPV